MAYHVRNNAGAWVDSLLSPVYYRNGAAWKQVKEGDFYRDSANTWKPILRFTSQPFGGWASSTNMIFQLGISPTLRTVNAKLACGGSSTMAGFGLSSPNRLEDRLLSWLTSTGTGATLNNYAVGGYTLANLRTVANGGTSGQNCEAMAAVRPTFAFILEPTNWAATYDVSTQITYMLELVTFFTARGILPFFGSSMPRTPYSGTQDTRLVTLNAQLKAHPILKYLTVNLFDDFLKVGTTADLRDDYDQGDGIHLNATGVQAVANKVSAFITNALRTVTAFDRYEIEHSANGSTGWSVVDTITDMTVNRRTLTGVTGYYRSRARLKNGAYDAYSATTFLDFDTPPPSQRILIDFGGDGVPDGGVTDGGVMTPNNSIPSGTPGQDGTGKWWNNVVDCRAFSVIGNWITNPVDTTNTVVTGMTISADKKPGGTLNAADFSMNFQGATVAVGEYPLTATGDSVYFDPSAGLVTLTFVIPAGRTATVKFWGSRNAPPPRILQVRKGGDVTFQEYEGGQNSTYTQAATLTGLTGTATVECQIKSGSSFGYISVMDITLV